MADELNDNRSLGRYELTIDGATAFITYRRCGNVVILMHTEVPGVLSGRSAGSRLAKEVLDHLKKSGVKIVPECPFIASYVRKHPEFRELVEKPSAAEIDARLDEALAETFPASDPLAVSTKP
jgi:predicted GNAT family acetyltransferase